VETSAGIPLTSMRSFAAAKWSAWLVLRESSLLSGSLLSYTQSATYLTAPCRRLLTESTQKILGLQKPSVSNFVRRPNKRAGMHAHGQVGVQLVASEPPQAPGYNTSPLREIGQQEDFWPILCYMS